MLDLGRYLLGVAEIGAIAGFATLGASALRARLLPSFSAAPAHLATAVLALALLIWAAEILGTFGLLEPVPYILCVAAVGLGIRLATDSPGEKPSKTEGPPRPPRLTTYVALAIAGVAVVKFALEAKVKLGTGMTGFDSTWYHGPLAVEFFQAGSTWGLHFIAPQFLAWFYPANAEAFHAVGMLAFDRDVLSPLLNLGWFIGCLLACWCIGRPYRVAPWSLVLGAIALSVPAFADQAGEARNDIVGAFFLLAAVAIALNARLGARASADLERGRTYCRIPVVSTTAPAVAGLAAGLAAGTKLNFLLPAAVLVVGLAVVAPPGSRWRALGAGGLGALSGGGYWYLRNLVHGGNPLPWIGSLGPVSLPSPDQALGGREGHSVLGYLLDGAIWSEWLLPGFADGLWIAWPLLLAAALAGLLIPQLPLRCSFPRNSGGKEQRKPDFGVLRVAGAVGLAAMLAWLIAPTSASGPEGMPRGFESGLRYLVPALILGLAILPPALLPRVARWRGSPIAEGAAKRRPSTWGRPPRQDPRAGAPPGEGHRDRTRGPAAAVALALLAAIAIGYPVQRHYLENRYTDPTFAAPGLNAAFEWSRDLSGARIATTATRQYPLYGTDLSNRVQFIGEESPHGGFTAPTSCRQWRRLLNEGDYDYAVTSRDRMEKGKPAYPPTAGWTEDPSTRVVLRERPTIVFRLTAPLDPSACSR
jgi:hypothetical protein